MTAGEERQMVRGSLIVLALLGWLVAGCASSVAAPAASSMPVSVATAIASQSAPSTATPVPRITIAAVGDLMFARDVTALMIDEGIGYPFARAAPLLEGSDLLIGNLEGTFTERGTPLPKQYAFRSPPALAAVLDEAGFDAVSLANNHTFDFGEAGLRDTLTALREVGVPAFGAGLTEAEAHAPLVLHANGLTVAFLGYNAIPETQAAGPVSPGVAWATAQVTADVHAARGLADFVVVTLHAGTEYSRQPAELQRAFARAAIDAGASAVIGHHPHVLQPWERYGDGVILYSLGNFVFDLDPGDLMTLGPEPFETAVAVLTLAPGEPPAIEFRPAYIDPAENRPRPATPEEAAIIEAVLSPIE